VRTDSITDVVDLTAIEWLLIGSSWFNVRAATLKRRMDAFEDDTGWLSFEQVGGGDVVYCRSDSVVAVRMKR
jgi:hypothetical protein